MFTIVHKYYDTAWNDPDLNNMKKLLSNDVVLDYVALDEQSRGLTLAGIDQVFTIYKNWDSLAKRLETKKIKFDVTYLGDNTFKVEYEIEQPSKISSICDTTNLLKFVIEDTIHVRKEGDIYLIDKIKMERHRRTCI